VQAKFRRVKYKHPKNCQSNLILVLSTMIIIMFWIALYNGQRLICNSKPCRWGRNHTAQFANTGEKRPADDTQQSVGAKARLCVYEVCLTPACEPNYPLSRTATHMHTALRRSHHRRATPTCPFALISQQPQNAKSALTNWAEPSRCGWLCIFIFTIVGYADANKTNEVKLWQA
jgi:hypothetical protein